MNLRTQKLTIKTLEEPCSARVSVWSKPLPRSTRYTRRKKALFKGSLRVQYVERFSVIHFNYKKGFCEAEASDLQRISKLLLVIRNIESLSEEF